jgi:hypothetical protein
MIYIQIKPTDNKKQIIEEQKNKGLYFMGVETSYTAFGTLEEWLTQFIRPERNKLLQETDYLMLPDNVEMMTKEEYETLKTYRQNLRDLPESITPSKVNWPVKPIQGIVKK